MASYFRKEDVLPLIKKNIWCSSCDKPIDNLLHENNYITAQNMWMAECHGERVGCAIGWDEIDYSKIVKSYIDFPKKWNTGSTLLGSGVQPLLILRERRTRLAEFG